MNRLQERLGIPFVSGVIVIVLGAQLVAGLVDTGRWGWPIVAYPMYKTPHYENERVLHDFAVYAEFDDGMRLPIKREELGMQNLFLFESNVVDPIIHKDPALLAPVVRRLCTESGRRLKRFCRSSGSRMALLAWEPFSSATITARESF